MRLEALELRVPPLLVTVVAGAVILALGEGPLGAINRTAGLAVALPGLAIALAGVVAFRRARTTVDPRHPERSAQLVTHGIYRLTRNPMYVGFVAVLLGLALALETVAGAGVALLVACYLDRLQIRPEERLLAQRFGAAFDDYRRRVARWV